MKPTKRQNPSSILAHAPISRRSALGALAWMATLPLCAGEQGTGSVIVIGAGAAGLSAARELQDAGIKVKVLEADSRIGGRILTDQSLGIPIDLGAAWLHGAGGGNPLVELFENSGVGHFESDSDSLALYRDEEEISDDLYEELDEAYEDWMDEAKSAKRKAKQSESMQRILESLPAEAPAIRAGLRWMFASEVEIELAADARELSLRNWDEDELFSGPEWFPRKGYGPMISYLARGLDISLGSSVKAISRTGKKVKVESSTGTLEADAVIVTVSLGVLQSGAIRFDPALSEEKRDALSRMRMGTMMKTVLEFPKSFWPDVHRMGSLDNDNPIMEFWNLKPLHNRPVLVGLSAGNRARELEQASDATVREIAMENLRSMFGKIPDSGKMLRTRWYSNPLTKGSYSMIAAGSSLDDHATMGEMDDDRIVLAGEGCNGQYPSTVHGAVLSARKAARQILRALS